MIDSERLNRWYNFQAPFYHAWRDKYDSPLVSTVSDLLQADNTPIKVLDVGCGSGLFSIGVGLRYPEWIVTGIDPSQGLLRIGRREAVKRSLSHLAFFAGSAHKLPFSEDEFDAVIAAGVLPNINDHLVAFSEMRRVLKTDGTLIIVELDRDMMTRLSKLFVNVMIIGYRVVSRVLPQFRFSDEWSITAGTVDKALLQSNLKDSGFSIRREKNIASHMIIDAVHVEV